jgi:hypothetical protein
MENNSGVIMQQKKESLRFMLRSEAIAEMPNSKRLILDIIILI